MRKQLRFYLAGVKSVAFFFSAIGTQGLRKEKDKDKTDDEKGDESDGEPY